MFDVAEDLLQQAGMEFRDVVRTWIHLRDIDRDYADLNRARRAFFAARGIDAVTGQHRHRRRAGARGPRSLPGRLRRP